MPETGSTSYRSVGIKTALIRLGPNLSLSNSSEFMLYICEGFND